jgi:hypothetical protein
MPHVFGRRALGALAVGAAAPFAVRATEALPTPQGRVILSISGLISNAGKEGTAEFDRAMLEAMGLDEFETTTPWYEGRVRFEGVRMEKLMATVGAKGQNVTAVALNNYSTDIPVADFARFGTLLALKRNGAYMPVRDKGPLFIVYPYDSAPELKAPQYYTRSAWQVAKLIVS